MLEFMLLSFVPWVLRGNLTEFAQNANSIPGFLTSLESGHRQSRCQIIEDSWGSSGTRRSFDSLIWTPMPSHLVSRQNTPSISGRVCPFHSNEQPPLKRNSTPPGGLLFYATNSGKGKPCSKLVLADALVSSFGHSPSGSHVPKGWEAVLLQSG